MGITIAQIKQVVDWQPDAARVTEIPFKVARVLLQDYTGVPLLADLAAMRDQATALGKLPNVIEPLVPVHLVIDHSVQTEVTRHPNAIDLNMQREFARNQERYAFMKWGAQAFKTLKVTPPGVGIVHQVNLEQLAECVTRFGNVVGFDSVIGTDSHTTMVNGLGVLGFGVGGIEAEAAMLGQSLQILTPDVVGVHLSGVMPEGVLATDLVLTLTQILRRAGVVGKIVEYFGDGAVNLSAMDRATIANMAPDYGATMGFFAIDERTLEYLHLTGRSAAQVELVKNYCMAQHMFGIPQAVQVDFSQVIEVDLATIKPSVAGPGRPQDRIDVPDLKKEFQKYLQTTPKNSSYVPQKSDVSKRYTLSDNSTLSNGDILIAGITSCTNTSNPQLLMTAGLLAKKAMERKLTVHPRIKTSLAPGSRAAETYLTRARLMPALEYLGFGVVGYGCATCIGNVGALSEEISALVLKYKLVTASVLSGNRNFEARIHPLIKANFLMSPPLVIAYAIAGTVNIDLVHEPLGSDQDGKPVYLAELWPSSREVQAVMPHAYAKDIYRAKSNVSTTLPDPWEELACNTGATFAWQSTSTYIAKPPFLDTAKERPQEKFEPNLRGAKALLILGDSITTDHISPAGKIAEDSPAGAFLMAQGVKPSQFNSYGARRGHHEVMARGTFANTRLKNLMPGVKEGGYTRHQPSGDVLPVYAAAQRYQQAQVPLIIFAGKEYGTGSSRDWAAKGTKLLGVKAVIAQSFERIHRNNLVGMGIMPCQFKAYKDLGRLALQGDETFDVILPSKITSPKPAVQLHVFYPSGETKVVELLLRLDTLTEVEYFYQGGILPYVMSKLMDA